MINYTQFVTRTDKTTIEWLETHGYDNPLHFPDGYTFPVFLVGTLRHTLSGINTTCLAASGSCGNPPIVYDFERLKEKLSQIGDLQ